MCGREVVVVVGANAKAARVGGGARGAVTARAHHAAGIGVAVARCRMRRCLCANRLDTDFPRWQQ